MKPITVTNDDLGAFVTRKRKSEVYLHSSELEIVLRERDKMEYFLAAYLAFALCGAFSLGVIHTKIGHIVPWIPLLWLGGYILIRKNRKLDGYLSLIASRNSPVKQQNG
jgi:hypothetical protein